MRDQTVIEKLKKLLNITDPKQELAAIDAAEPARSPAGDMELIDPLSAVANRVAGAEFDYTAPVTPQAVPGVTPSFKNEDTLKQRTLDTDTKRIDPEILAQDITPAIMRSPQIASQQEGIDQLQKFNSEWIKSQNRSQDYAPLIGFLDQMSGGNALKTYQRPRNAEELSDALFARQIQLQRARDALADNIANLLNASKQGQTQTLMEALTERMVGSGLRSPQVNNPMEKIWSVFDKSSKKYIDRLAASEDAMVLLNENKTVADEMLKRSLIKLSGDDRPSNTDVASFGGDSRLLSRVQQWYDSKFDTGTLSDLNREDIRSIINGMTNLARMRLKEHAYEQARVAGTFQPSLAAMAPKEIAEALYSRAIAQPLEPKAKQSSTKTAVSTPKGKTRPRQKPKGSFKPKSDAELEKMTGPEIDAYLKSLQR